jgi:hypothetical protein
MDAADILRLADSEQERACAIIAGLTPCPITLSRATTQLGSFTVDVRTGLVVIRVSRYLRDEAQVRDTVRHELAHHAAHQLHRHVGHGPIWRMWARYLGCEPVSCSGPGIDPEVARRRERYAITCGLCGWTVMRQRRSRLVDHPRRYRCRRCSGPLEVYTP